MSKTLFVTTGATVVFEDLLDLVLSERFVNALSEYHYTRLIVQYGTQRSGEATFLKSTDGYERINIDNKWIVQRRGFIIEGIPYCSDIKRLIEDSELVISHAGTGSILDALRVGRKLIVVINSKLMDDHQTEVADELAKRGNLLNSKANIEDLLSNLRRVQTMDFLALPTPRQCVFQEIIEEA